MISVQQAQMMAVRSIVGEALASLPRGVNAFQATVTAVSGTTATITWNTKTFPVPHLAAYTPTVGDVVLVLLADTDPVILGRIVGIPTS